MTKSFDVIIIGAGISGASISYHLARDGFNGKIGVFEKDPTYEHSTTCLSNAGVREQFSTEVNIRISMYTLDILKTFEEEMTVNDEPVVVGFKNRGYLILAKKEVFPILEKNLIIQKRLGAKVGILTPQEILKLVPDLFVEDIAGGSFGRRDGYLDPYAFLMAYIKKGKSLGVQYIYDEVVKILKKGNRALGVETKKGDRFYSSVIINAAGPWAAEVGELAGIKLPIVPLRHMVFIVNPPKQFGYDLPLVFDGKGVYFRDETGGKIFVSRRKEDEAPGFDFRVDYNFFNEVIWPELAHRVPLLNVLKVVRGWAACYSVNTIDSNAIIGEHPELKGFYLATGFSGHGLQQAPAVGKGLSEWIRLGRYETIDLSPLRFARFANNELVIEESVFFSGEAHKYI